MEVMSLHSWSVRSEATFVTTHKRGEVSKVGGGGERPRLGVFTQETEEQCVEEQSHTPPPDRSLCSGLGVEPAL